MVLTAVAIVAYVGFVGPSPSVLRAAVMAGVVMAARELGRPSRAAAAIGWAIAGLLLISPPIVEDPGFRLSALATVGLISWGTPLTERLAGPSPGRVRSWLAESLGVSLAAQLATLPVVVLSFGRLSIVSPVVNLGVVPLVAPAMGAGALALGGGILTFGGMPSVVATLLGLPAWVLFSAIVGLVRTGAAIPFASLQLEPPWDAVVAAVAGVTIVGTARWLRRLRPNQRGRGATAGPGPASPASRRQAAAGTARPRDPRVIPWWRARQGRWLAGGLMIAFLGLAIVVVHRPDGIPRVTVLDVGQGDAILVEGNRGGRLLVDGGPDPGRLLIALDEHLPPWDRRIDLVILSHPHEDHAAGLAALLGRYAVSRVLEPGMIGPGPGYAAPNAELLARGIRRGTLATGDRLAVDDIRFQVLWPDRGSVPERPPDGGTGINNVSIVLLGDVDGHRFLLAGDIEEQIDPQLLARGLPTVDFLKVAHHGSRTSSTEAFLTATRPAVAVISAGAGNPYGHPAPATVARLKAAGARVFRTDDDGSVTVDLGPGPLHERATGGRSAALVGSAPRTAFLCGLPPPPVDGLFERVALARLVAPGATAPSGPPGTPRTPATPARLLIPPDAALGSPASDVPRPLGYDSPRDDPDASRIRYPAPGGIATDGGRLLLGRRRLRHRGRGRGLPAGSSPVPGGGAGTLASPGRNRGERAPPRRARCPPGHRHDVRGRHGGHPRRRRPARPEGHGSGRLRGPPGDDRRGQRPGGRRRDGFGQEGSPSEGPRRCDPLEGRRGSALRGAPRRGPGRLGRGARPGARHRPRGGRGPRAGDTDRGFVREGDVDRRNQGRLAVMELEKLALRRAAAASPDGRPGSNGAAGGPVTVEDVRDLVPEVVPGSIWGFVDAVGMRQRARSLELLERLLEATPEPVLLAVLHRRLRELLEVADRVASGESPGSLVRSMRLQPFRAETLARQARTWTVGELAAAMEGLLELDRS